MTELPARICVPPRCARSAPAMQSRRDASYSSAYTARDSTRCAGPRAATTCAGATRSSTRPRSVGRRPAPARLPWHGWQCGRANGTRGANGTGHTGGARASGSVRPARC
eukprot:4173072-Prymnesium_polylepis.1